MAMTISTNELREKFDDDRKTPDRVLVQYIPMLCDEVDIQTGRAERAEERAEELETQNQRLKAQLRFYQNSVDAKSEEEQANE
jgi:hypothetical protein